MILNCMPAIAQFEQLLEQNFRENRHPLFYASAMGMTYYQLNQRVKHHFGKTLYDVIQDRLHREILDLLSNRGIKLGQIAHELGCCDQAHLSRSFKKRMGVGPRAYRRELAPALG
ncbi:helix-turn-helix domain-containing protein [Pedobacter sp. JY14-1]|uniref:helix-turn-helix domain-containing protein n=1 Tax=Pedobacter sp. JY14-1 TaxID=3034151 RepID=UPI0023E1D4A7|nr:helix-turn-helix domain-containing protein [Pedobacter sp. JY14-1]